MSTTALSEKSFEQTVREGIVFIDFWASWCGPCRSFAPVYEKMSENHPDIVFGKVNTEEEPNLAAAFNVSAIPTLMIFRDGIPLFAQPGALPGAALEELVKQVRALDMDKVRRDIATEAAKRRPRAAEEETNNG